jgi:hypothetical protein
MARSAKEDPPMNGARWRSLVPATAATGALLLAACGEDDSDIPSTTAAPPAETTTSTAAEATTTTATTVVLIEPGDPCGVYGAAQQAGDQTLYCDGEVWGTTPPPSTTAAPEG